MREANCPLLALKFGIASAPENARRLGKKAVRDQECLGIIFIDFNLDRFGHAEPEHPSVSASPL